MASGTFPESTGSSSKYSGTSNDGAMTGMGMDPVGDSSPGSPMTGGQTSAGSASMSGADDPNPSSSTTSKSSQGGQSSQGYQGNQGSQESQSGKSSAQQATDRYKSMAHDTVDKVADFASRYTQSPNKAMEASKSFMQEKPAVALGAAVAFGLLLGRLILR